jgi:hypothetical protein
MQGLGPVLGQPWWLPPGWTIGIRRPKQIWATGRKAAQRDFIRAMQARACEFNRGRPAHEHLTRNAKILRRMARIIAAGDQAVARSGKWRPRIERMKAAIQG